MKSRYRSVQISIHTFDKNLPLVSNAEHLEIEIDLFSEMSKNQFKSYALETAERFWNQMQKGRIKKTTDPKDYTRKISADSIGNS